MCIRDSGKGVLIFQPLILRQACQRHAPPQCAFVVGAVQAVLDREPLEDEYTFAVPIDGVGMVFLRMPITNCVDGSADGVSIYEPAMGLIHRCV